VVILVNRISLPDKACVELRKGVKSQLLGNTTTGGLAKGVFVHTGGAGTFESNLISKCVGPVVEVSGGSCPVFKENELVGGAGVCVGVVVHDGARPEVLNNVFKECGKAGMHISDAASPLVRRNKMFACAEHGIFITGSVSDACVVEENEMMGCQLAGIVVISGPSRR
jgi:hypothetical protein